MSEKPFDDKNGKGHGKQDGGATELNDKPELDGAGEERENGEATENEDPELPEDDDDDATQEKGGELDIF
jgi:hypothetical protein